MIKDEIYKNEEEIKKCEIKINDELIPFNYFYTFKSTGRYEIKYSFKNKLKNTTLMFRGCSSLTKNNIIAKDRKIPNIFLKSNNIKTKKSE